jgi:hypothetical protein
LSFTIIRARSNLKIKTDFYGYDGVGVATIAITIDGEGD